MTTTSMHVQATLTDIQHDHHDVILSTLHVHLDHHNCLEVLIVRGKAGVIKQDRRRTDRRQRREARQAHRDHNRQGPSQLSLVGIDQYMKRRQPILLVIRPFWLVGRDSVEPIFDFFGKSHGSIPMDRDPTVPAFAGALLLLVIALLAAPAAQAQFTYASNDGTITITGYTGPGGAVTIPAAINGLPVTSIGGDAFLDCDSLTSVTIPGSVTNIGVGAFAQCAGLTSVTHRPTAHQHRG